MFFCLLYFHFFILNFVSIYARTISCATAAESRATCFFCTYFAPNWLPKGSRRWSDPYRQCLLFLTFFLVLGSAGWYIVFRDVRLRSSLECPIRLGGNGRDAVFCSW